MNTIQDVVNAWLKSEQFTQVTLLSDENQEINKLLDPDLQNEIEIKGNLPIESTFGFVPMFDSKGNVSIYARFGGPERILYTPNNFGNFSVNRLITRFGKGANPFVTKTNSGQSIYSEDLATERYNLQDAIFQIDEYQQRSLNSLNNVYPFRVQFLPKSDTQPNASVELQFRTNDPQNPYQSLIGTGNVNTKSIFVIYLLQNCANSLKLDSEGDDFGILRNAIMNKNELQNLVNTFQEYFVAEFMENLKLRGAQLYSKSFFSGVGFDWYFKQFIEQMQDSQKGLGTIQTLNVIQGELLKKIEIDDLVFTAIQNVFKGMSLPIAANEDIQEKLEKASIDIDLLKSKAANTQIEHDSEIETLEKKLEAQAKDFEKQNAFEFSMLGAAAGVGAAYYTLYKDKPDLENWERGAILAIGGLLGSIPYLNLVSIAATPILIEKGIEFKKNRS